MKKLLAVLVFCWGICCVPLLAEPYQLTVPQRGWAIEIELPPLAQYQGQEQDGVFQFMGRASEDDVIISVFVEPSDASTSKGCRELYWSKASRNPVIVKSSVSQDSVGDHPVVAYIIEAEHQGQSVRSENLNVYVSHRATCIDVHLSVFPRRDTSKTKLAKIASTLAISSLE